MEILDSKRSRKPVNYAVLQDSDDDFSEFTPPVKKKKDEKSKLGKPIEAVNAHNSDSSKDKSSNNLNSSHSSDKSKEKSSDIAKTDKERDQEKEVIDKEKDKHRDREKKDDKERDRHRDKERRDDKDRDRHEKRKDKDHKKRDKDSDRHKNKNKHRDRERDTGKHSDKEEKNNSQDEGHRNKKDKKHDKRDKEEERKTKDKRRVFDDVDDDFKDSFSSPKSSSRPLTSTQKSPGRQTPKARLTLEERMFQRELEAALTISKLETTSGKNYDKVSQPETEEGQSKAKENTSCNPVDANEAPSSECPDLNKEDLNVKDSFNRQPEPAKEKIPELKSTAPQSAFADTKSADKEEKSASAKTTKKREPSKSEKVCEMIIDPEDPEPSTSTGLTRKRQRKKVVFFEESDSDSFDGFEGSELSEESDFSPSPVKRKEKPVKPAKTSKPSKSPRTTTREPSASKSPKQSASETKVESSKSPAQSTSKTKTCTGSSAKENTAPVVNRSTPAAKSNSVSTSRLPDALSKPERQSSNIPKTASSATTNSATRIGLVKVPFRSPVIQSSGGTTPNYVPQSPNTIRKIGVRLGLSRSNIKTLHPGLTGK